MTPAEARADLVAALQAAVRAAGDGNPAAAALAARQAARMADAWKAADDRRSFRVTTGPDGRRIVTRGPIGEVTP